MTRIWQLIRQNVLEISGFVVILLAGALGLVSLSTTHSPYLWIASILVALLMALNILTRYQHWWQNRIWRQRLLMALLTLNTIALLAIPDPSVGIFALIFFVLSVTAAMLFEPREWAFWILGFAVVTMIFYIHTFGWANGVFSSLIYISGYYFFASFAKSTSDANHAREEIERLYTELQSYAQQAEELAVADERNRLAREMHDTVGHRLTVSAVQLQAIQKLIARDPARAQEMVGTVQQQVSEALAELRQTVAALRAPMEEDLSLNSALPRLTSQFAQATGLIIDLQVPKALPPLPAAHRHAFYRAAQELLTNVQKHADAKHVWMQLQVEDSTLALHVRDDGSGVNSDEQTSGFGLRGLRERANQLGGSFQLIPHARGGSLAIFHIPLPRSAENNNEVK